MTESEMRMRRCCFTGHRTQKLWRTKEEIKTDLETSIKQAIADECHGDKDHFCFFKEHSPLELLHGTLHFLGARCAVDCEKDFQVFFKKSPCALNFFKKVMQ